MAGVTYITISEFRYKKYKIIPYGGNWAPGDWARGDRVEAMWEKGPRGPGKRVERYRKNLIANKVPFIEGGPCMVEGYAGPVIEFLMGATGAETIASNGLIVPIGGD